MTKTDYQSPIEKFVSEHKDLLKIDTPSEEKEEDILGGPEKIELQDGETAYFKDGYFQKGVDGEYGYPYARADTFISGKNGPEIEAFGGHCIVVTFFDPEEKIGVVMHLHVSDIYKKRHEELIDAMMTVLPELSKKSEVHLLADIESKSKIIRRMNEDRIAWKNKIVKYLKSKGYVKITEFIKGDGKDVRMDTTNGSIRVFDDNEKLIFQKSPDSDKKK